MLSYAKLWILLEKRGMKKTDLKEIISGNTLAKLGKNETISSEVIERICDFLDCQPGDIMEYISEKKLKATVKEFGDMQKVMIENLANQGISKEDFQSMMSQFMPQYIDAMFNGENPLEQMINPAIEKLKETEE